MTIKKLTLSLAALALMAPVALTGCIDRTERVEVQHNTDTAPVIVPDRDVDVNVQTETQPAPNVIEKNTNTTIEKDSSTGMQTETKTESTTVN